MSDDTPDEIGTIAIEPPEVGTEVTVHYHSKRSGDRTTRTGTLREYNTNESGHTLCFLSHSHQRHITVINFDVATVVSATREQETVLGPLVALSTPDQELDAEVKVQRPNVGALSVFEKGAYISDEFDERIYLTREEIQTHISNTDWDEAFNLEDEWGTFIPVTLNDLFRAKHRFDLARRDGE